MQSFAKMRKNSRVIGGRKSYQRLSQRFVFSIKFLHLYFYIFLQPVLRIYPGSRIRSFSIIGSRIRIFSITEPGSALGNMIRVVHPGSGSGFIHTVSRIHGSKRYRILDPDPQHC